MRKIYNVLLLFCCMIVCACGKQEHFSYSKMEYADLLRIHQNEGWTGVEVLDAWHEGQVLHRYILVPIGEELPEDLPDGTLIRTPLQRVVAFSSVHGELFCDLGCADQMVGICDAEYVLSDSLIRRLKSGKLKDMGTSMQVDVERMIAIRPDAFFVSPLENAGYGPLGNLNVPLIECEDYMETSALGRAEWMKFYGLLMGRELEADALFAAIEKEYKQLMDLVDKTVEKPSLLCDLKQGAAWYVPGGESYIGKLFSDAGAHYLFSDHKESGSVAMSFENVYAKGRNADIWVVKYGRKTPYSYQSIADDFPSYKEFRPWKKRKIYGCNTFSIPFYEEIPFHPHLLLRDMVKIFHPELLPDYKLKYYVPMAE